jgi:hypothetical protein
MAAAALTLSGSRFLRPKLSRFFNQVAQVSQRIISGVVKGTAALVPLLPDIFASRFFSRPRTPSPQAITKPRTPKDSQFLRPKLLSRFFNEAARVRPRISRFMKGTASLIPPMPDIFSSQFFAKPRTPPRHLRPNWPRRPPGKPRGPSR